MALCRSKGYAFQMEIAVRAKRLGYTIEEVSGQCCCNLCVAMSPCMAAMIEVFPAALLFICASGFSSRPHEAQPAGCMGRPLL